MSLGPSFKRPHRNDQSYGNHEKNTKVCHTRGICRSLSKVRERSLTLMTLPLTHLVVFLRYSKSVFFIVNIITTHSVTRKENLWHS